MAQIHRLQVQINEPFEAPLNLTFDYQAARGAFSVWYIADQPMEGRYKVVGTGPGFETPDILEIVDTVCTDGFHVWHLVRLPTVQITKTE